MVKLFTILVRKPLNYEQLLHEQKQLLFDMHTRPELFKINTIVELSHDEFSEFKNNLFVDRDFIKDQDNIFLVKEKGTDNYSGLIVDAQGFSYPRYVGIPMQEVEIKKCPRCSSFYTAPSAISRKDNKTEICSACGVEEALEAIGLDKKITEFLDNAHYCANRYNAKIIIQMPDKDDVVIEPD